jgi:hypothetical protein
MTEGRTLSKMLNDSTNNFSHRIHIGQASRPVTISSLSTWDVRIRTDYPKLIINTIQAPFRIDKSYRANLKTGL